MSFVTKLLVYALVFSALATLVCYFFSRDDFDFMYKMTILIGWFTFVQIEMRRPIG